MMFDHNEKMIKLVINIFFNYTDTFTLGGNTIEASPGSSTSVLAQLAALAEASAPLKSPSKFSKKI